MKGTKYQGVNNFTLVARPTHVSNSHMWMSPPHVSNSHTWMSPPHMSDSHTWMSPPHVSNSHMWMSPPHMSDSHTWMSPPHVSNSHMWMFPPHVSNVYAHCSLHLPKKVTRQPSVNHTGSSDEPPITISCIPTMVTKLHSSGSVLEYVNILLSGQCPALSTTNGVMSFNRSPAAGKYPYHTGVSITCNCGFYGPSEATCTYLGHWHPPPRCDRGNLKVYIFAWKWIPWNLLF